MKGLNQLINNEEKRIELTFQCFDRQNKNRITRNDFLNFFEKTWTTAFRLLGEEVIKSNTNYSLTISQIESWAQQNSKKLQEKVSAEF